MGKECCFRLSRRLCSLRGRRFKGMGKGVLGAREARGGVVSRPNSLPFPFERLPRRLAFVGRDEKRVPLKMPAWEATRRAACALQRL